MAYAGAQSLACVRASAMLSISYIYMMGRWRFESFQAHQFDLDLFAGKVFTDTW